jgi:hypothetical protein
MSPVTTKFASGRANIALNFDLTPGDSNSVETMWRVSSVPAEGKPTLELSL